MKINNFYSYESADFKFNDYNLIVGPNNSGKTNLIRMLNLLKESNSIDSVAIPRRFRYNADKPSLIHIRISLNDVEAKLLLEIIFKDELNFQKCPAHLKDLDIIVSWTNTISDFPVPEYIVCRFDNGFTLYKVLNSEKITFSENIGDLYDIKNLLVTLMDVTETGSSNSHNYQSKHAFSAHNLINDWSFRNHFFEGHEIRDYFVATEKICTWNHDTRCNYDDVNPRKYISNSIEFLDQKKAFGVSSNIWLVLTRILLNNLVFVKEIFPSYQDITSNLLKLKLENEVAYYKLQEDFESLFKEVSFSVKQHSNGANSRSEIIMHEKGKEHSLEESASGHLAAIHILYNVLNREDSMIILDEPEVHFHPTKITEISEKLLNLSKEKRNQIIVITHSPHFLDFLLSNYKKYNVIHIKKENSSVVKVASADFVPGIKSHIFNSEVFFASCVIIVEGPSDEFALKAISDSFGGILSKNNVIIVDAYNWNRVDSYIDILLEYGIPYIAMVDKEYNGNKPKVVKFERDLEHEIASLGWNKQPGEKLNPEKTYSIIIDLISNESGKKKIQQSKLWNVINMAIT